MNAWFLVLSALLNPGGCHAVHGDQIFAADLARALPVFSAIPGDVVIGLSPLPETRRTFPFPELSRIAKQYGIEAPDNAKTCFEWKMRPVTEEAVRAAIRETLRVPEAHIEILAINKRQVPEGKLVFPLSGLSAATNVDPATPVTWRGEVEFHSAHHFTLWARVRISSKMTRVIANQVLLPGQPVAASQVTVQTLDDFPLRNDVARALDDVVGRAPLHAIRPGAPILRTDLRQPLQVQRGETVLVTAVCGAAQLRLEAIAENPGRQGDMISLKNPRTGNIFRARVDGRDQALVVSGSFAMLTGVQ
jgi:flagella basal body P-ring formation protein FlgA